MADIFNNDFVEYIDLLNKYKVEYVLVGGMAVNLHGYRRSTGDMDVFVNATKANHKKLAEVHRDFGMMMGEMELLDNFLNTEKYDVYTFGVSPIQIDILTACKGIDFEEVNELAIYFEIAPEVKVRVLHLNSLIQAKTASNRTRDRMDIEELNKVNSINE